MTDLRADLIEAGADAVDELPFDTLELRNWGEEGVADPYRIVSEAVINRVLDTLADRADEWADEANVSLTWRQSGPMQMAGL